jgi:hypothetical protein
MNDNPQRGVVLSSDEAKAAQEVAKVSGKAVDAVAAGGSYLANVLGDLPQDAVGILGDIVKRTRRRLAERAEAKLRERGVVGPRLPSPTVLLPLLEAAERETRDELAEVWASLLATAMEPGRERHIRRAFFDTLAMLEPPDALVLAATAAMTVRGSVDAGVIPNSPLLAEFTAAEWEVSLDHLDRQRLVKLFGNNRVELSAYGVAFMAACEPRSVDDAT